MEFVAADILPVELYDQILNYLNIYDVVKARLVCCLWRDIVDKLIYIDARKYGSKIRTDIKYKGQYIYNSDIGNKITKCLKINGHIYYSKCSAFSKLNVIYDYRYIPKTPIYGCNGTILFYNYPSNRYYISRITYEDDSSYIDVIFQDCIYYRDRQSFRYNSSNCNFTDRKNNKYKVNIVKVATANKFIYINIDGIPSHISIYRW